MGLQEHAGDMEQKQDEDLDAQGGEEEQEPASTEEAEADAEQTEKQDEAKEEGPKTKIEEVVSEAVDKHGPQPPVEEMVELAQVFGYLPGEPEYDEFMDAVQKFCGNDYAEQLEGEFDKVTAEPEGKEDEEEDADSPPEGQNEADAAAVDTEGGDAEQKAEDPAALEQEGPAAEEVPAELADAPAVQDEIAAKGEEAEEQAPAAEDVKDENAEAVEAESTEEAQGEEEAEAAPPATDLRRGDQSPDVEELQIVLVGLGLMTQEEMDTGPGIFGPRTEHALKAYQESMGLPATGFYGPQTRESLAQAAEPASPTEQIVMDLIAAQGPQPDFGIMVAAFMIVDAGLQPEFMTAVATQCGDDYATQLQTELDNAASAPAEGAAADSDTKNDEAPVEPSQDDAKEADAPVANAPEEEVETEAAPEEVAEAKAEVVEVAPEVVPEDAKEEVAENDQQPASADAANANENEEEEASENQTEDAVAEAQEEQQEKSTDDVAAAPDAKPEEKEEAAAEEQDQLAEAPEEAKVDESEASEESEEELEAKKEQTENELAEEVAAAATAESLAALQAMIEEADSLLAAGVAMLEDPVLETTQETVAADAEAMLSEWDADVEAYAAQLTAMADKLLTPDVGSAAGSEDVVQASQAKADELRDKAASLDGAAPAKVTVNAQLQDGSQLSFEAPISSRDSAVQDILQAFNDQMALHEGEQKGEDAPALPNEDPTANA